MNSLKTHACGYGHGPPHSLGLQKMTHAQLPGMSVHTAAGFEHEPPQEPIPPIAWHGPRTQPHSPVSESSTHSSKKEGHTPAHEPPESGPQGAEGSVVLVVDVVVVVVVVVLQPPSPHASQQLATAPTQALPPWGATQRAALRLIEHNVLPELVVRQQVTKPGFPHVDLAAQYLTARMQLLLTSVASAAVTAHCT